MPALSSTPPTLTTEAIEHFWSKIQKGSPDECWPFMGCLRGGYGTHQLDGKLRGAHRIAHFIATGEWPAYVLHSSKCTTRRCCNPHHLRSGTCVENINEARALRGNWTVKGERNGSTKITERTVRQFRKLIADGMKPTLASRTLGISKSSGFHIFHGHTWSWLK